MKKKLFYFILLCLGQTEAAFAGFTIDPNDIPAAYSGNSEYMAGTVNGRALTAIGAHKAYTGANERAYEGVSGAGSTVAVLDSGTFEGHEDLAGQFSGLASGELNITAGAHGTHVTGMIAASKNGFGIHGVAYGASILPVSIRLVSNPGGLEVEDVFVSLSDDAYDSVKIINNSWGSATATEGNKALMASRLLPLAQKGKLIVASAGNDMTLTPNPVLAELPQTDSALKNNMISAVSYDPTKDPADPFFIAGYSNLAVGARKWTLAAPGTFYSSIVYDPAAENPVKYDTFSGTSMAAPMISGAAALVQEAFPYMDGKQIADVLFSTAFKKEDLNLSPYMIQTKNGRTRFLYFTEDGRTISDDALSAFAADKGYDCSGTTTCHAVTFEDVFGQGLLNVGDAVKGPKYFDAERLSEADYDVSSGQFFYTADTAGYDSEWSNDISQKVVTDAGSQYANKNVGLKKRGNGTLTLSGSNTFAGTSVVEEGELLLKGRMTGPVRVLSMFSLENGTMDGAVQIASGGLFSINGGTMNGNIENYGRVVAETLTNNSVFLFGEDGEFSGTLHNNNQINVTGNARIVGELKNAASGNVSVGRGKTLTVASEPVDNKGVLTGGGTIVGTVNNVAGGAVGTSLTIDGTLNSSGRILLEADGNNPAVLSVGTLNLSGGKFALAPGNTVFRDGKTYTVVSFGASGPLEGFERETRISDYISAVSSLEDHEIKISVSFLRLTDVADAERFLPAQRTILKIADSLYIDKKQEDFGRFYSYSAEELKKQTDLLRSKVRPVQNEQLPLTKSMASQVYSHLLTDRQMNNLSVRMPQQRYRGRYYRGRSGGSGARNNAGAENNKVWGQFLGGVFREDGNADLKQKDLKTRSAGAMFGYDHEFSERFVLGLTAGAAASKTTQDKDEIVLRDYRAGFYTASRFGRVTFNTVATGGLQKYSSERHLELLGQKETAKADYDGRSAEFDANLGVDLARPYRGSSFFLRAYLAANVNYIRQNAYKEKGDSFLALGVKAMHDTSVGVSPGLSFGFAFSETVLTADVGYQRLVSGGKTHSSAYFLADTEKTAFSSLPADTDRNFFNAGLGVKTELSRNAHLNLWAGARKSDKTEALNVSMTLAYDF